MELRGEGRGPSKLEYVLISILVVILIWATWIMLEPVVWPALEHFVQSAFEEVAATPTPTPAPEPELSGARLFLSLAPSMRSPQGLAQYTCPPIPRQCLPRPG